MVYIFLTEGMAMKREEKNQQTRRRIMDSALMEFAQRGGRGQLREQHLRGPGGVQGDYLSLF